MVVTQRRPFDNLSVLYRLRYSAPAVLRWHLLRRHYHLFAAGARFRRNTRARSSQADVHDFQSPATISSCTRSCPVTMKPQRLSRSKCLPETGVRFLPTKINAPSTPTLCRSGLLRKGSSNFALAPEILQLRYENGPQFRVIQHTFLDDLLALKLSPYSRVTCLQICGQQTRHTCHRRQRNLLAFVKGPSQVSRNGCQRQCTCASCAQPFVSATCSDEYGPHCIHRHWLFLHSDIVAVNMGIPCLQSGHTKTSAC